MQAAQLQIRITLSLEQINPIVQDYLQTTAADHVKGINQTTCDRLRSTLNAGLAEGESIDQLKNRVAGVFTDAKGYRSQMIARTETAQAYSYANEQALEATGVVNEYQWLTAQDERVCPICGPLHGERRNAGQQYTSGLKPAFAHNSVPMQRDWTREGDCVFQEYRCEKCNKLLFRGSLKLLLGKKHSNEAFIEPKCDRCGKINHFSYDASSELRKSEPAQSLRVDGLSSTVVAPLLP